MFKKDNNKEKKYKEYNPALDSDNKMIYLIIFVFFYFILFSIISINSRNNKKNISKSEKIDDDTIVYYEFSDSYIKNENYSFIYSVELDGKTYLYSGKKYNDKELFNLKLDDKYTNYYKDKYYFYERDINNGKYLTISNPYIKNEYLDIDSINSMLDNSEYVSKTDYESGKTSYNYEITNKNLYSAIYDESVDDLSVNSIFISTDQDKYINEIKLDLSGYCKYKDTCKSLNIELEYDNFNDINKDDFDVEI